MFKILTGTRLVYKLFFPSLCSYFHQLFVYIFFQSPIYHVLIIVVTLTNAWVTASITFRHTVDQKPRAFFFQIQKKFEIGFTIFYDMEVLFKIFCFSLSGYMSRSMHKFELLLAVMTTIHVLPIKGLFLSWISIFQVSKNMQYPMGQIICKSIYNFFYDKSVFHFLVRQILLVQNGIHFFSSNNDDVKNGHWVQGLVNT